MWVPDFSVRKPATQPTPPLATREWVPPILGKRSFESCEVAAVKKEPEQGVEEEEDNSVCENWWETRFGQHAHLRTLILEEEEEEILPPVVPVRTVQQERDSIWKNAGLFREFGGLRGWERMFCNKTS
jgi:hypothetical protein